MRVKVGALVNKIGSLEILPYLTVICVFIFDDIDYVLLM